MRRVDRWQQLSLGLALKTTNELAVFQVIDVIHEPASLVISVIVVAPKAKVIVLSDDVWHKFANTLWPFLAQDNLFICEFLFNKGCRFCCNFDFSRQLGSYVCYV